MLGSLKMPLFLNTQAKWDAVVESIDTVFKFDEMALRILDEESIDIFDFRDIICQLGEDVKKNRPEDGEIITMLTFTITDLLEFLMKKSEERLNKVFDNMAQAYDE